MITGFNIPMTSPSDLTKQQAFVQRTLEERNIRFVRLWFTDVLGFLKSVAIAPAELENAFAEGIGFDGSATSLLGLSYRDVVTIEFRN